jgi:UDP-2,4-diacetamido-2,4,6-trideoxy-beta-L-altropyranose hydrolase
MSSDRQTLLIRADASTRIGTGHVMRCLALAQAWQDTGGKALFMMVQDVPALAARLTAEGVEIVHISTRPGSAEDAQQTAIIAQQKGAAWVIADGYHFGADYQRAIKHAGLRMLLVDDYGHASHYCADLVLNQNISATELLYANREPYTCLLLGTQYALLRREFWPWRGWRREISDAGHKVLVTLGGGDPDNVTLKVIQALQKVDTPRLEAKILVGPANPNLEILRGAVECLVVKLQFLATASDMSELMAWADLAISAGGSTCWELAFMGLPSVVLALAEDQCEIAEELDKRGVALNLGWHEKVAPAQIAQAVAYLLVAAHARAEMAGRGRDLVGGEGVDRVLMWMRDQKIRLRRVREADGRLLWEWANDPTVRAVSFSPELIPWEGHLKWLGSKLNDPDCFFYIAINKDDDPIGQIRFDVSGYEAVISISVDANFRDRGYGAALITLASQRLYRVSDAKDIHAYVKPGNEASVNAFMKAGFRQMGMTTLEGQEAVQLILSRENLA